MDKAAFEAEGDRILTAAGRAQIPMRLLGALAFAKRCPGHAYLQERLGRKYTDIDLAAYGRDGTRVRQLLAELGYRDDPHVYMATEGARLVADHPTTGLHLDVFFDRLEFCHTVPWDGRLELDSDTIPLAELLLQKMQIVEINEKDLIDTMMLLLEHRLVPSDDGINLILVTDLCARDWGWWRTLTMNLDKVRQMADHYPQLSSEEKARVRGQVGVLRSAIDASPKTVLWKLRAKVGDRKRWYRVVGELLPEAGEV